MKETDKVAIINFVNSRHILSHTDVADVVGQLKAREAIFRKVKKKRQSFFISDLADVENSSLMKNKTEYRKERIGEAA